MTTQLPDIQSADAPTFASLLNEVMATAERFGHREHVQLTWLAVSRCGVDAAITVVSEGIQSTARYAGVPQKYNETMSRAWVVLVGIAAAESGAGDFSELVALHPELLDKKLLTRYYRSSTLAAPEAKHSWIEPDLAPLGSAAEVA